MKLTNVDRQAFVSAVMADIPKTYYSEQAHKLILAEVQKHLPPEVLVLWNNKELKHYIETHTYSLGYPLASIRTPVVYDDQDRAFEGIQTQLKYLREQARDQNIEHEKYRPNCTMQSRLARP